MVRFLTVTAALFVTVLPGSAPAARPSATVACRAPSPPDLYRVKLAPTAAAQGASGVADLVQDASPFGVPLTVDGRLRYEARIAVDGLPAPSTLGDYAAYVVWAARSDLSGVQRLAVLDEAGRARGVVAENKFVLFITAEAGPDAAAPAGPVLLRGLSPSSLMQNMLAEPLGNGGMPPC